MHKNEKKTNWICMNSSKVHMCMWLESHELQHSLLWKRNQMIFSQKHDEPLIRIADVDYDNVVKPKKNTTHKNNLTIYATCNKRVCKTWSCQTGIFNCLRLFRISTTCVRTCLVYFPSFLLLLSSLTYFFVCLYLSHPCYVCVRVCMLFFPSVHLAREHTSLI